MHATVTSLPKLKQAVHVDTIVGLSDPLSSTSSILSLVSLLSLAYQAQTPIPSVRGRLLTLMHTMCPASATSGVDALEHLHGHTHEEIVNSFIQLLSPVLNGMAGMVDFLDAVDAFSRPEDFRDFWSLEGSNLITEFIEEGGPYRVMNGCDIPFVKAFVADSSCRIALGRDKCMLMLVPGDAKIGDDVWTNEGEHGLRASREGGNGSMHHTSESFFDGGSWRAFEVASTLPPVSPDGFVSD